MTRRSLYPVLILAALTGCGENAPEPEPPSAPPAPPAVITTTLQSLGSTGRARLEDSRRLAAESIDITGEISTIVETQQAGVEHVARAMNDIATVARQSDASARLAQRQLQSLSTLASNLAVQTERIGRHHGVGKQRGLERL